MQLSASASAVPAPRAKGGSSVSVPTAANIAPSPRRVTEFGWNAHMLDPENPCCDSLNTAA